MDRHAWVIDRQSLQRWRGAISLTFVLLCFAVVWEIASRGRLLDPVDWPPPSEVLRVLSLDLVGSISPGAERVVQRQEQHSLAVHTLHTLSRWLLTYVIAAVAGVSLGTAIVAFRRVTDLGASLVNFLRSLPSVAIWPVAFTLFGLGLRARSLVVVFGAIWPIAIGTMNGLRGLPQEFRESIAFLGLSRSREMWLRLQMAAGSVFTGLEVSCAIAFLLTVTAEILDPSDGGLGWYLHYFRQSSGGQARVFGAILWMALVGLGLNTLVSGVRRSVLFWEDGGLGVLPSGSTVDGEVRQGDLEEVLLEKLADDRLREALISDDVTGALRSGFLPTQLIFRATYNLKAPYLFPSELRELQEHRSTVKQRDFEVRPRDEGGGAGAPVFFARSWIATDLLPTAVVDELNAGRRSLGEIVRSRCTDFRFRTIGYRLVSVEGLSRYLETDGAPQLIERTRSLSVAGRRVAIIKEYASCRESLTT